MLEEFYTGSLDQWPEGAYELVAGAGGYLHLLRIENNILWGFLPEDVQWYPVVRDLKTANQRTLATYRRVSDGDTLHRG